jgi:hypothetical protein
MRRWRLITTLALLALLAVGLAVPLSAAAHRARTAASRVSASVTGIGQPGKARLVIRRNGQKFYDQPVRSSACGSLCVVTALPPGKKPVQVRDLDSDGQPEVLLGVFSGGAHCCFVDQVFSFDPGTMTYVKIEHNFLDSDPSIQRLDGHDEFVGDDARVAEASFTDYADSGAPLAIWRLEGRRFVTVTTQFPARIKADAATWLRLFNHHLSNGVGLIAAWAADEDLLGNGKTVSSTLNALAAKGALRTPLGLPHNSAKAFVTQLEKLLHQLGYTK